MSSFSQLTVESKVITPTKLTYNLARGFDAGTGLLTTGLSGSVSVEFDLEEETDSDTFFANWLLEKKPKLVTIDVTAVGEPQKFLTLEMEQAQIVGYLLVQDQHINPSQQNGFVTLTLAAPAINVGQAPFTLGQ